MSYEALVKKSIRMAFTKLKDLAVDVTFTNKTATSFDFATQSSNVVTATPIIIRAVILKDEIGKRGAKAVTELRQAKKRFMLFKQEDLPTYSAYADVTIAGEVWKMGGVVSAGYVTMVELFSENS
jgi:hypothetical protein